MHETIKCIDQHTQSTSSVTWRRLHTHTRYVGKQVTQTSLLCPKQSEYGPALVVVVLVVSAATVVVVAVVLRAATVDFVVVVVVFACGATAVFGVVVIFMLRDVFAPSLLSMVVDAPPAPAVVVAPAVVFDGLIIKHGT